MDKYTPESCCFMFSLEIGATIIGVITLALGVLFGILRLGLVQSLTPVDGTEYTIEVILVLFAVAAGLSLIFAVKTQKKLLCWPYFILQVLVILLMIYQLIVAATELQGRPIVQTALAKISENIGNITDILPAVPADQDTPSSDVTPKDVTTKKPITKPPGDSTLPPNPVLEGIEDDILVDFLKADPPAGFKSEDSTNSTMQNPLDKTHLSDTRLIFEVVRDAVLAATCLYCLLVVYSFYRKLDYVAPEQKPDV